MSTLPRVVSAVGSGAFTPASEAHLARELAADGELLATVDSFDTDEARAALAAADVLVTGWRTPRIDAAVLDAAGAPALGAGLRGLLMRRARGGVGCMAEGLQARRGRRAPCEPGGGVVSYRVRRSSVDG